ncbi:MAG TPA: STAS domain-containing protein [Pseudonocardia sp.]|nr:STAS domain-containing protein [Pseudonocardia sp.]
MTILLDPAETGSAQPDQAVDVLATAVTRPRPGTVLLTVSGEIDTLTAPRFESGLTALLDDSDAMPVVDLTRVTFLASSGLAALIRAAHRAADQGRRLLLVAPSRAVTRPLEITGSDQLFDLCAGLDEALAVPTTGPD